MSTQTQCPIYASPMEVAGKIAAAHGEKPSVVSIPMIGSNDVESFVTQILTALSEAHRVDLNLD
jgi:hypothetical protein